MSEENTKQSTELSTEDLKKELHNSAGPFETFDIDIDDSTVRTLIQGYVQDNCYPASIETFNVMKEEHGMEKALYNAILNDIMLNAIMTLIEKTKNEAEQN